jgi:hypothetical protein
VGSSPIRSIKNCIFKIFKERTRSIFKKITFKNVDVVVEEKTKKNKFLLGDFVDIPGHFFFPARFFVDAHTYNNSVYVTLVDDNGERRSLYSECSLFYPSASKILKNVKKAIAEYRNL